MIVKKNKNERKTKKREKPRRRRNSRTNNYCYNQRSPPEQPRLSRRKAVMRPGKAGLQQLHGLPDPTARHRAALVGSVGPGSGAWLPHPTPPHPPLAPACQPWLRVICYGDFGLVLWGHLPADPNREITHSEILRNKAVSHPPPACSRRGFSPSFSLFPSFFLIFFFPLTTACVFPEQRLYLPAVRLPCVPTGWDHEVCRTLLSPGAPGVPGAGLAEGPGIWGYPSSSGCECTGTHPTAVEGVTESPRAKWP